MYTTLREKEPLLEKVQADESWSSTLFAKDVTNMAWMIKSGSCNERVATPFSLTSQTERASSWKDKGPSTKLLIGPKGSQKSFQKLTERQL